MKLSVETCPYSPCSECGCTKNGEAFCGVTYRVGG